MLIRFCLRHTKKPKIACFYRLTVALPSPGWYSWLAMKPGCTRKSNIFRSEKKITTIDYQVIITITLLYCDKRTLIQKNPFRHVKIGVVNILKI